MEYRAQQIEILCENLFLVTFMDREYLFLFIIRFDDDTKTQKEKTKKIRA